MKQDRGNTFMQHVLSLSDIRRDAAHKARTMEWPGPADEYWRRTDLSTVDFEAFPAAAAGPELDSSDPGSAELRLFTVADGNSLSGRSAELLKQRADASRDRVEAFHFSRIESGFSLRIPAGTEVPEPIILRFKGVPDGSHEASFAHIHAERGSAARLFILLEDLPEAATLRTAGFHFELDEGSSLQASVLQDLSLDSRFFAFHSADVAGGAALSFSEIDLGAALSVSAPVFNTRGEGADINITGLYAVAAGQHKNMRPVQRHAEPHGSSTSLYKGALIPGGRTVFQGLIRVEPGAVKTDAYLSNKNLLMADGARADSIPSLQILNNDVRCTHGSTTGKLDPEQVFYLQSRGFDRLEAERMLLWGFYEDALGKLPGEAAGIVRERLAAHPLFSDAKE